MSLPIELDFGRIKVCGRKQELKQLRQALHRAAEAGSCEAVLVEGQSGAGKSFFIEFFHETIAHRQDVFFCQGKYDEEGEDPFGALEQCLSDLLGQMLSDSSIDWRSLTAQNLTRIEQRVLAGLCPAVHNLTDNTRDEEDSVSTLSLTTDGQASGLYFDFRLRLAVRSLIRMVCEHRTVVFVQDDLQWVDETSLDIIKAVVFDKHAKNLLFIATHREIEVMHIISELKIKAPKERLTELKLGNLDLQAVTDVVSNLTRRDEVECKDLATVLKRRTGGNAFFLVHFLRVLNEKGLLYYSGGSYRWEWDLDRIVSETDIADNVLDVVSSKIQHLDDGLQIALKSAAFLASSRFDINILSRAMPGDDLFDGGVERRSSYDEESEATVSMEDLAVSLDQAVKEGLLEKLGASGHYKFAHDKIRESCSALLPQGQTRERLHLDIGRKLRDLSYSMNDDETQGHDRLLLLAVHHLNLGSSRVSDMDERNKLIDLNYRASEIAFERLCFIPATKFLQAALAVINVAERWKEYYDQSLRISTTLAHVLFCSGKLNESEVIVHEILQHARDLDDKLGAFRSLVYCQHQSGRSVEAIHTIKCVLKELGFHVPNRHLLMPLAILNFIRIKRRLGRMSKDKLLNLPKASDHDVKVADFLSLLGEISVCVADSEMEAATASSAVLHTLKRGSNPYTSFSIAVAGFMFGVAGDYETASKFGKIAIQLVDEDEEQLYPVSNAKAILACNFFINHLKQPLPVCLEPTLRAKKLIMDTGAVENIYMAIVIYSFIYFHCGLNLEPLYRDSTKMMETISDTGQHQSQCLAETHAQFIQNLMGKSADPLVLTGEVMDQDRSLKHYTESKNERAIQSYYFCRMCLGYYFDDMQLAEGMSSKLFHPVKEGPTPLLAPRFMFQGLIAFSLALSTKRRKYARRGRSFLKRLEKMVRKKCVNVHHMMLLLKAESASLHGEVESVQEAYDKAIRTAGKLGLMHNQALGNERAGVYFLHKGDLVWASTYLSRAWMLYQAWGAKAKAVHLEGKYKDLIDTRGKDGACASTGLKSRERFRELSVSQQSAARMLDLAI